jgi:polyisoprenoid-binding protein YceI
MRSWIRLVALLSVSLGAVTAHAADKVYTIDAGASDVHWLVYKAGAFARLGHNHVIAARALTGSVTVDDRNLSRSSFELVIPVAELTIDEPALRAGLGADFASVPTADDVAGTRRNMLSERVLAGDTFSTIRITGRGPEGAANAQTLKLTVELLGRTVDLTVPTKVEVTADGIVATGQFELNHADLGMQPFTVMMGALQVGEKLSFSYRVVAHPTH